jgi:hypothetical protein
MEDYEFGEESKVARLKKRPRGSEMEETNIMGEEEEQ